MARAESLSTIRGEPPEADVWRLQQLAYRYADAVDSRDVAAFLAVFETQGRLRSYHPGARAPFADLTGHDELATVPNAMQKMFRATAHLMTNHLLDVNGDAATGTILCTARHLHRTEQSALVIVLRYADCYTRHSGDWKIVDRQIRFLWSERHDVVTSGF